jgi:hypothetical protein
MTGRSGVNARGVAVSLTLPTVTVDLRAEAERPPQKSGRRQSCNRGPGSRRADGGLIRVLRNLSFLAFVPIGATSGAFTRAVAAVGLPMNVLPVWVA